MRCVRRVTPVLIAGVLFAAACQQSDSDIGTASSPSTQAPRASAERHADAASANTALGVSPKIVAFGDSLTAGAGLPAEQSYPAQLQRRLAQAGYPYRVINAGVSGDTTAGGVRRVEWVLKSHPDIVILELGANDGLRGLPVEAMQVNLDRIIERLKDAGVQVVLTGMKLPLNYGEEYREAFESMYRDLAARHRLPFMPFFLEGVGGETRLNQADGIHPTSEGYERIVDRLWPVLIPLLQHEEREKAS